MKAVKAGEDPNAGNPAKEVEPEEEEAAPLDPNDPEVQAINGTSSVYEQPSAQAAPEKHQIPGIIRTTTSGMSPFKEETADQKSLGAPSPLKQDEKSRQNSVGGGYFPEVSPTSPTAPELPSTLKENATMPTAAASSPPIVPPDVTPLVEEQPPTPARAQQPSAPAPAVYASPTPAKIVAPPGPAAVAAPAMASGPYLTDDEAVASAMKHAKWATSALNFEDVPTAVKELQEALRSLGAL